MIQLKKKYLEKMHSVIFAKRKLTMFQIFAKNVILMFVPYVFKRFKICDLIKFKKNIYFY